MLTVNELIISLRDTKIPTILVEGEDDIWIFRELRSILEANHVDIQPCGGRGKLLQIFERRSELGLAKIGFIADQDLWIYTGTPAQYKSINFTKGYSIENDLLSDFDYRRLLGKKNNEYNLKLTSLIQWYSHELRNKISGSDSKISESVYKITNQNGEIKPEFLKSRNYHHIEDELYMKIINSPDVSLRGKTLLQFISWFLAFSNKRSNYTCDTLLDLCVKHQTRSSDFGSRFLSLANSLKSA
jgi:hypothetical protein